MPGASWLHVSQSMQVESTKKSPGTFSGKRCCRLAITTTDYTDPSHWCSSVARNIEFIDEAVKIRPADAQLLRRRHFISLTLQRAHDHLALERRDCAFQR